MASKKNNALKKQLYGTQFPLQCLRQPSQQQQCGTRLGSFADYINHLASLILWGKSHQTFEPDLIHAEFHSQGQCVWVTKEKDMSILFRQGFFGKGTLSRSEPTWKERNTAGAQGMSLEEITRQRRIERAQLKLKKTGQLIPDQGQTTTSNASLPSATKSSAASSTTDPTSNPLGSAPVSMPVNSTTVIASPKSGTQIIDEEENYEHLQLSLEEAFFLVFAIECISITDAAAVAESARTKENPKARASMSIQTCWLRFAEVSAVQQSKFVSRLVPSSFEISAGNPFIVRYVVYHYYRSQGWIVKDGLKYGADFLLYQKGLVFGHSQYAVQVVPFNDINNNESSPLCKTFRHVSISPTPGLCSQHQALSWQWLLTLNRVIAQVQKTVILCHVELPGTATKRQLSHPRTALPLYKVTEIGVKRFIPEKNRA